MVPLLPSVTIFSATERAALALAKVVVTRLCSIKLQTRLASIALRCSDVRPSLAVRFKCLMAKNFEHPTSNIQHRTSNDVPIAHPLDVGCSTLVVGCFPFLLRLRLFLRRFEQSRLKIHSERQTEAGQLVLDFVQRLLAEVAIFEHFLLGLLR